MNQTETNPASPDLSDQVAALQRQVFILLVMLVIASGTLSAYLCYQSHVAKKDIQAIRPQAMQIMQNFNQVQASINPKSIEVFLNQLVAFGQTHPDFRPVLLKYGISPQTVAPKK